MLWLLCWNKGLLSPLAQRLHSKDWNKYNWSECLCHLNKHLYFDLPKCQNWKEYHCSTPSIVVLTTNAWQKNNNLRHTYGSWIWQGKLFSQALSRWKKGIKESKETKQIWNLKILWDWNENDAKEERNFKNAGKRTCLFRAYLNKPSKNLKKYLWKSKNCFSLTGKISIIKSPASHNILERIYILLF